MHKRNKKNTQVDDAKDNDAVMTMYSLIEYRYLWQYYKNKLALNSAVSIVGFSTDNNISVSFKFNEKITGQAGDDDAKNIERVVLLRHLSIFWRTLEMPLSNCDLILTYVNCDLLSSAVANQATMFQL